MHLTCFLVIAVWLFSYPQTLFAEKCKTESDSVQIVLDDAPDSRHYNWFRADADRSHGAAQGLIEPLFAKRPENERVVGWLARSYRMINDRTVEIRLRRNAEWSDGEDFTAEDVVFSITTIKENTELDGLHADALRAAVETVTARSKTRVRIALTRADPLFVEKYLTASDTDAFTIVPEHIWASKDPNTFTNDSPIGTGAYLFSHDEPGWPDWRLNERWWGAVRGPFDMPIPVAIELRKNHRAEDDTRALTRGCIDILMGVSPGLAGGILQIAPFVTRLNEVDDDHADLVGDARWTGWESLPGVSTESVLSHHARWMIHDFERTE